MQERWLQRQLLFARRASAAAAALTFVQNEHSIVRVEQFRDDHLKELLAQPSRIDSLLAREVNLERLLVRSRRLVRQRAQSVGNQMRATNLQDQIPASLIHSRTEHSLSILLLHLKLRVIPKQIRLRTGVEDEREAEEGKIVGQGRAAGTRSNLRQVQAIVVTQVDGLRTRKEGQRKGESRKVSKRSSNFRVATRFTRIFATLPARGI